MMIRMFKRVFRQDYPLFDLSGVTTEKIQKIIDRVKIFLCYLKFHFVII